MTSKQWLKWDEECSDLGVAASALHACIADLAAVEQERDEQATDFAERIEKAEHERDEALRDVEQLWEAAKETEDKGG